MTDISKQAGLAKSCVKLIEVLLFCAWGLAAAEVGQKPFPKIEGGSGNDSQPPRVFSIPSQVPSPPQAPRSVASCSGASPTPDQHVAYCRSEYDALIRSGHSDVGVPIANFAYQVATASSEALRSGVWLDDFKRNRTRDTRHHAIFECMVRGELAGRNGTFRTSSMIIEARIEGDTRGRQDPPCRAHDGSTANTSPTSPSYSPSNSSLENQRINNELNEARVLALRNQERADQARRGLPKLHKGGSVAHACIQPSKPSGGMVNNCPYAIEYSYCVYRPFKNSWSEGLDCEKTGGGSWQAGPGPNKPILIHMGGEMTYWFACKYGETLTKPDGISPVDIEFQRGRGLLGRCGEWGSSKGK